MSDLVKYVIEVRHSVASKLQYLFDVEVNGSTMKQTIVLNETKVNEKSRFSINKSVVSTLKPTTRQFSQRESQQLSQRCGRRLGDARERGRTFPTANIHRLVIHKKLAILTFAFCRRRQSHESEIPKHCGPGRSQRMANRQTSNRRIGPTARKQRSPSGTFNGSGGGGEGLRAGAMRRSMQTQP